MAQNNLKSMIGNGSVMHMGYCFLGLGVCSSLGAKCYDYAYVCTWPLRFSYVSGGPFY